MSLAVILKGYEGVRGGSSGSSELRIPSGVTDLDRFRLWTSEEDFPEDGRIDYLAGELEVDLSPEDLYSHGVVKSAIAAELHSLVVKPGLGNLFIDRTRVVAPKAGLSAEPDLVVVLWESIQTGRVREVASRRGGEDRYLELEGAPDLIVEIVSDGSVRKDRERLPRLYAKAGVPELWTIDARGAEISFDVGELDPLGRYLQLAAVDGWRRSEVLGCQVRLVRRRNSWGRWTYELDHQDRR